MKIFQDMVTIMTRLIQLILNWIFHMFCLDQQYILWQAYIDTDYPII